ncbi:MAG TPA: hypothetical protein VGG68_15675 [Caulobacteraceae bacterium]
MSRPDRVHYVIDIMPDYVTISSDGHEPETFEVVQIWVDPDYPDAHRDPDLRAFLERRARDRIIGLIRWSRMKAAALIPPSLTEDGRWNLVDCGGVDPKPHTLAEVIRVLA